MHFYLDGCLPVTTQAFLQVIASGLLLGLIYALIAVGLSLVFGLMDVVNFAHGEFLMLAMYATFGLVFVTALDLVVLAPLVVALMLRRFQFPKNQLQILRLSQVKIKIRISV